MGLIRGQESQEVLKSSEMRNNEQALQSRRRLRRHRTEVCTLTHSMKGKNPSHLLQLGHQLEQIGDVSKIRRIFTWSTAKAVNCAEDAGDVKG